MHPALQIEAKMDFVRGEIFLPAFRKICGEGRRQIDKRRQTDQYHKGGSYSDAFQHVPLLSNLSFRQSFRDIGDRRQEPFFVRR
jgi:hypothetical protein